MKKSKPTKDSKFFVIAKGRLAGIWSDSSWIFDERGMNIGGGRPGMPFFPEQHQELLQDVAKYEAHLREQLAYVLEAKEHLSKIRVLPSDIAETLRNNKYLTKEQSTRVRRLERTK